MFANQKAFFAIVACALAAFAQSSEPSSASAASSSSAPASASVPSVSSEPSSSSSASVPLPSGIDSCILGCVGPAAMTAGCGSFTNLACVCTSSAFQQAAGACISANCPPSDLQAAQQIQSQQCGALSASTTASTTASTASSASSAASSSHSSTSSHASSSQSSSSSGSSPSPTASSPSSAMALSSTFSFASIVGTLVASAGVLVGTTFAL